MLAMKLEWENELSSGKLKKHGFKWPGNLKLYEFNDEINLISIVSIKFYLNIN